MLESVSLGDKRFVAVVRFAKQRFLIGGTASSLCLLSELQTDEPETTSAMSGQTGEDL